MSKEPSFLERLRQYEALLDSRISEINQALEANEYPHDLGGVALRHCDRLTSDTYHVAKDDLYQVFPELREKNRE